jgi:preprotein translocase subunit SecG
MIYVFLALIVIASALIALFILIQNPKGGGLAGTIGGFNTQFMGVKQTTDVLEKGTWVMAIAISLLCIFSSFFIPKNVNIQPANSNARPVQSAPLNTLPQPPAGQPLK